MGEAMTAGMHPGVQIRIDEARRNAEIPPTAAHGMSYGRLFRRHRPHLHLPHLHLRRRSH
jgi:hypothetical protein